MHKYFIYLLIFLPTFTIIICYTNYCRLSSIFSGEEREIFLNNGFPCWPKDFGHGSIVCQCNVTYCDTIPPLFEAVNKLEHGHFYYQVQSDKNGSRFLISLGKITSAPEVEPQRSKDNDDVGDTVNVIINRDIKFQEIFGFGGAFTDATGINMRSLPESLQDMIIRQYFDDQVGINYIFGRVPIGGTDFSTWTYSYDDEVDKEDVYLKYFRLRTEDLFYKIPFIQRAMQLQPQLKLIASAWSAPKWMKTNNNFSGKGSLRHQYYQVWANYFVKFLESYLAHNITFWGITTQNEPKSGMLIDYPFNCMGWTADETRDWIKWNLGPTLRNSSFPNVKIMIIDDDRINLATWPKIILGDKEVSSYVSGIAVHWYADALVSASLLDRTHDKFPQKWILATEASTGFLALEKAVILGSWERAEMYAEDIISDLNHWVTGWVDWNMALNMSGGPNWAGNEVDSPIIVDRYKQVIYKQPMFYALGHFSKFIPPGSIRISTKFNINDTQGVSVLSCLRPDGLVTVVILNVLSNARSLQLNDTYTGFMRLTIKPKSIYTLVYA